MATSEKIIDKNSRFVNFWAREACSTSKKIPRTSLFQIVLWMRNSKSQKPPRNFANMSYYEKLYSFTVVGLQLSSEFETPFDEVSAAYGRNVKRNLISNGKTKIFTYKSCGAINNISLIGLLLRGSGRSLVFGCVGCYKPNKRVYHNWHHPLHSHVHSW